MAVNQWEAKLDRPNERRKVSNITSTINDSPLAHEASGSARSHMITHDSLAALVAQCA